MEHIDVGDLNCRASEVIQNLYHKDWFFELNGSAYFSPPSANIDDGVIKFINGRHRSILLSRHLSEFPFLIGNLDLDTCGGTATSRSLEVLKKITSGKIVEHSFFNNMPNLKFGDFDQA